MSNERIWEKLIQIAFDMHGKDEVYKLRLNDRLYPLKVLRSDNSLTYYIMLAPEEKGGDAEIYAELRVK